MSSATVQPEPADGKDSKDMENPQTEKKEMNRIPKFMAEFTGTFVLVLFGCGSIAFPTGPSFITISFAFGLALVSMIYAVGPTSGCHVNPAVSLAMWITGNMLFVDMILYWVAQFVGAVAGAAVVFGIVSGRPGYELHTKGLGSNCWGTKCLDEFDGTSAFFAEVIFTFIFIVVILGSTMKVPKEPGSSEMVPQTTDAVAGLAIGLTLVAIHLCGIPITGVSVNPARSFGPAVIVGGDRLNQLWLFFIAPFLGAALAGLVFRFNCPLGKGWSHTCPLLKKFFAEFFGTYTLVLLGAGTAVFTTDPIRLNIAVAFGLALIAAAYGIGGISGGHINPAVTLGVFVAKKLPGGVKDLGVYWTAQFLGGIMAAATLFGIVSGRPGYTMEEFGLGTNGFGPGQYGEYVGASAFFAEMIFTFLFLVSILGSTAEHDGVQTYLAGVSIGLTLVVIHIISIPITGTSVNPARSLGPALFVGGTPLAQMWLFFLAPLLGGALAGLVMRFGLFDLSKAAK